MIVILGGVALIITTCSGGVGIITASGMLIAQSIFIGVESLNGFITRLLSMRWTKQKRNFVKE